MRKLSIILFSIWAGAIAAQTLDDVELFNVKQLTGSPRYNAMGGAFTALGNDFSGIHLNPAGAAVYRNSQIGGALSFENLEAFQNGFYEAGGNYSNNNLALPNLGFVAKKNDRDSRGTSGWAFGVTVNKMADFDRRYSNFGVSQLDVANGNTLAQYLLFDAPYPDGTLGALGYAPEDISDEAYAAYQAGILLIDNAGNISDYGFSQSGSYTTAYEREQFGNHTEIGLTLAGEKNDRIYYGASINFPTISFTSDDHFSESSLPADDTLPYDITSYQLNRYNNFQATGINVKFGVIYLPSRWFRLGASYQSPSWYTVDQIYEFDIEAVSNEDGFLNSEIISTGNYSYSLTTPAIYRAGMAFLLPNKRGLVSFDYEYSNPSNSNVEELSRGNSISPDFADESNADIEAVMRDNNTFKGGLELKFGNFFMRGGANYRTSFYQAPEVYRTEIFTLSGGLGYQNGDWGVDFSISRAATDRADLVHPSLTSAGQDLIFNEIIFTNSALGFYLKF